MANDSWPTIRPMAAAQPRHQCLIGFQYGGSEDRFPSGRPSGMLEM